MATINTSLADSTVLVMLKTTLGYAYSVAARCPAGMLAHT
jgi:hypothetical protein